MRFAAIGSHTVNGFKLLTSAHRVAVQCSPNVLKFESWLFPESKTDDNTAAKAGRGNKNAESRRLDK